MEDGANFLAALRTVIDFALPPRDISARIKATLALRKIEDGFSELNDLYLGALEIPDDLIQ